MARMDELAGEGDQAARLEPISVRIREACRLTGIGRSKFYELVASGDIEVIKVGTMTLVPFDGPGVQPQTGQPPAKQRRSVAGCMGRFGLPLSRHGGPQGAYDASGPHKGLPWIPRMLAEYRIHVFAPEQQSQPGFPIHGPLKQFWRPRRL